MLVNQLLEDLESGQLSPAQKIQFLSTISPYTKTKATKDLAKKTKEAKNEITIKLPKNSDDLPN
jgi:translation initiation factor RLI1